jgi:hypothetical protein
VGQLTPFTVTWPGRLCGQPTKKMLRIPHPVHAPMFAHGRNDFSSRALLIAGPVHNSLDNGKSHHGVVSELRLFYKELKFRLCFYIN